MAAFSRRLGLRWSGPGGLGRLALAAASACATRVSVGVVSAVDFLVVATFVVGVGVTGFVAVVKVTGFVVIVAVTGSVVIAGVAWIVVMVVLAGAAGAGFAVKRAGPGLTPVMIRDRLSRVGGRSGLGGVGVLVLSEMDVEVEEAHPWLAVAVPIEGGMETESGRPDCERRHQHRTHAAAHTPHHQPEAPQRHSTIVTVHGVDAAEGSAAAVISTGTQLGATVIPEVLTGHYFVEYNICMNEILTSELRTDHARRLTEAVSALLRRFSLAERADVACCGMTVAQAATLEALAGGGLRLGELGRRLGIAASTLSRNLDRLEERGLVRRGPDPDDRRARRADLTADGERAAAAVRDQEVAFARIVLERLPEGSEAATVAAIEELLAAVRSATEGCCPGAFDHLVPPGRAATAAASQGEAE